MPPFVEENTTVKILEFTVKISEAKVNSIFTIYKAHNRHNRRFQYLIL